MNKCPWCGGKVHREQLQSDSTETIVVCDSGICGWDELVMGSFGSSEILRKEERELR